MATGAQGNILVVTHGPGRGRSVPTGDVFFARLKIRDPQLATRLVIHPTGAPAPSLAGIGLVVFWLGDPLRQKYPACYSEAVEIAMAAKRRGIGLINPPDGLSNTAKAVQSDLWAKAGIPSAPVRCVTTPGDLLTAFAEFGGPCFLRGNESHAERNIPVLATEAAAKRAAATLTGPAALVRIHDVRAEHRAAGTPGLRARYHHKARAFVFRGHVKASHLFFSPSLAVGLSNSLLEREDRPKRRLARAFGFRRDLFDAMITEDLAYFRTPIAHSDILVRAVATLGLDVAAVDYSIRPDGTPILWEANPFFCLPPGEESVLSVERCAVGRVNASLDWMANCLRAALPQRLAS